MPICFLHVPKASGISTWLFLQSQFHEHDVCAARFAEDYRDLQPAQLERFSLFHAECDAAVVDLLPPTTAVVAMLRDPFERARSHWRYVRRSTDNRLHARFNRPASTFEDFVAEMPTNPIARVLAGSNDGKPRSLWGVRCTLGAEALLDRASARLESFALVGLAERHDESMAQVAHLFGWAPPGRRPVANAAPDADTTFTDLERERFAARNAVDIELYQLAVAQFARRARLVDASVRERAYEQRLAAASEPLTERLAVDVCAPIDGTGWLPAVGTGRERLRPIADRDGATIDLPVTIGPFTTLEVTCPAVARPEVIEQLELTIDDRPVLFGHQISPDGTVLHAAVPSTEPGRSFTRIAFRTSGGIDAPLHNGVHRSDLVASLGISRIQLATHDPRRRPATVGDGHLDERGASTANYFWHSGPTWAIDGPLRDRLDRLDLWPHLAELQRDGFTVVPDVVDPTTVARARDLITRFAVSSFHRTRASDVIQPLRYDRLFLDLLVHPVQLAMADAVCGKGLLDSQAGLVRDRTSNPQGLHAENALWLPSPYPDHHYVCSTMLTLDRFDESNGATCFVPGSHLTKLDPTPEDSVALAGVVTPDVGPGSLIIWLGGTWHGAHQRTAPGERVSLLTIFTRPSLRPAQDIRAIPASLVDSDELEVRLRRRDPFEHDGWYPSRPGSMMRWIRNLADDDRALASAWDEVFGEGGDVDRTPLRSARA